MNRNLAAQNMGTTEPVHEYFDIQVVHQNQDNSSVPLKFNETRTVPYIMNPSKYFMSVVRFNISTNLPVFIPRIITGQPDPNKTIYKMYINSGSGISTNVINFEWTTQSSAGVPGRTDIQSLETDYYYCYSYQYFLNLMNQQIQNVDLNLLGISKLWFELDRSTYNIKLKFLVNNSANEPRFFLNAPLKNLFETFPLQYVNNPPSSTIASPAYEIIWQGIDDQVPSTTVPFVISTDASPLPNWNPITSLVFTTNSLPIVATQVSAPKVYGNNTTFSNINSGNNISSIITDFTVSVGPNSLYIPTVNYLPTAEYRLNDMESNKPLTNIDLEVYWKDKYGNLYPLLVPSGGYANLKILFRKK